MFHIFFIALLETFIVYQGPLSNVGCHSVMLWEKIKEIIVVYFWCLKPWSSFKYYIHSLKGPWTLSVLWEKYPFCWLCYNITIYLPFLKLRHFLATKMKLFPGDYLIKTGSNSRVLLYEVSSKNSSFIYEKFLARQY